MIFNRESAEQQIEELRHHYGDLDRESESEKEIILAGKIFVNRTHNGFTLRKSYAIKIVIPFDSEDLPYVIDVAGAIAKDYPHRYSDGRLCLETDTAIRIRFASEFSLLVWMQDYVETYFFSYEYYIRYGEFPFGERSHGIKGLLETYQDLFRTENLTQAASLVLFIRNQRYRGHIPCPCGSGLKLRNCHGKYIMKYCTDPELKKIVSCDGAYIEEAVLADVRQRRGEEAAKRRKTLENTVRR